MKKDQKEVKPNGYCPECDSRSFGITSQRSTKKNPLYPWSLVLKSYHCQNCDTEIPAHLWNCKIDNKSKTKLEWNKIYRNKLGLFDIARRNRDLELVRKVLTICDSEIAEAIRSDDAEEYYYIKILCLIYLESVRRFNLKISSFS